MSYDVYNKPFLDDDNLINFLKDKNLPINNEINAKKILTNITYYRFKSYLHPFKNETTKLFDGTKSFEDIEKLYRFDDELRDKLFTIIGRIEVKLRSKLNYIITKDKNNPFWYLDKELFINKFSHTNILNKISSSFINSKEDYVMHYKQKYINNKNDTYKHLPPFWISAEIIMFGEVLNIYKSLDKSKFNHTPINLLDKLSKEFGARNLKELNSWLTYVKMIRNRCAHHSRVWNTNYFALSNIVSSSRLSIAPYNNNRIYSFLVILNIITKSLSLDINIKNIIDELMAKYPIFNEMKNSCGFPNNWNSDTFWSE